MSDELIIQVQGHSLDYLHVRTGLISCGSINDGIGLAHWKTQKFNGRECEGGWVISFEDLERIYQSAKAAREQQ